jgi:hypothetical protein
MPVLSQMFSSALDQEPAEFGWFQLLGLSDGQLFWPQEAATGELEEGINQTLPAPWQ